MPNYQNIREEELKNKIASDYFDGFDTTKIIGNVDFCVSQVLPWEVAERSVGAHSRQENITLEFPGKLPRFYETAPKGASITSLLWAEAKKGKSNIYTSFVQLILTIGKAKTYTKESAPPYLGAFDDYQMAFIPFYEFKDIFYQNDFNWNVTSSNYETKEFKQIYGKVEQILTSKTLIFSYETDNLELRHFIQNNFTNTSGQTSKIPIDRNNFNYDVYEKWRVSVKPSIIINWESAKKAGIIDGDFFLADLLSAENQTLKEKLYILLKGNYYQIDRKLDDMGIFSSKQAYFNDNQTTHNQFWNRYERPPREEYWDYIVERRDLLVPQDVRERKGSFFTPPQWVIKSQRYLADILGENWQDEYYIWDCAAGTGNLLAGLTNKYNIYASTLDKQDVDAMKDRIKNGANLLDSHVFQFDFLNDSFEDEKVPQSLREILKDPEKRKKLVIYINPPYAEAGGGVGRGFKNKVATENKTYLNYKEKLGKASNELFAQFLARIYFEIKGCVIGEFSTLKILSGGNSKVFRNNFQAKLESIFIMPADTFDNVKGKFPIGFKIWNTDKKEIFSEIKTDIFEKKGEFTGQKSFYSYDETKGRINDWLSHFKQKNNDSNIGFLMGDSPDFQNNKTVCLLDKKGTRHGIFFGIDKSNLLIAGIYFSARKAFEHTWINHNDQFLYPNDGWKTDTEFQNDCLAFALFNGKNRISSKQGVNNWIPFTENEVNAPERFESHFMTDFIGGKLGAGETTVFPSNTTFPNVEEPLRFQESNDGMASIPLHNELFTSTQEIFVPTKPLEFSAESKAVFQAGKELWRYYFAQKNTPTLRATPQEGNLGNSKNPSLYDIKAYFQGVDDSGRMNNKSKDEKYNLLITNLRENLEILGAKIQPKVYEFGFLK